MGNEQFKDDPQDVEEGKKTKVRHTALAYHWHSLSSVRQVTEYCKHDTKYGPKGALVALDEYPGPIRTLKKR